MPDIALIVVVIVVVLVSLVLLLWCYTGDDQSHREQDIEGNYHHRLRSDNDQMSRVQKLPQSQRRPGGAKQTNWRPGQRGKNDSFLHEAAIMKHIHPSCNSDIEAIQISTERDKKYETEVNHVFKINPNEFIEAVVNREMVRLRKMFTIWLLLIKDVQYRFTNQNIPVGTGSVRRIRVENLR